jgi:hypothetical protein
MTIMDGSRGDENAVLPVFACGMLTVAGGSAE